MKTELDVIYAIHEIVRGGEINQDDTIEERLLRSFLRIHRGKHLLRMYNEGMDIPDEVFQSLGSVEFNRNSSGEWITDILPKTIRLKNYGFMAMINGYPISVVNAEEFRNSKKSRYNKHHPLLKYINEKMTLSNGVKVNCCPGETSLLNETIELLKSSFIEKDVSLDINAVLVDPDDAPGYDFTKSAYPFPDELIEDLINSVNAREFNLYLRVPRDEVGNSRSDVLPQENNKEEM